MASSIHVAARSTLDVDVAAELDEEAALGLIAALQRFSEGDCLDFRVLLVVRVLGRPPFWIQ